MPITTGVLDYFSNALAEVAKVSKAGNDQHNPGQQLHWARGKSTDQADCIARHLIGRGTFDTDGQRHSAKLAWRALALLQEELEAEVYPQKPPPEKPERPGQQIDSDAAIRAAEEWLRREGPTYQDVHQRAVEGGALFSEFSKPL